MDIQFGHDVVSVDVHLSGSANGEKFLCINLATVITQKSVLHLVAYAFFSGADGAPGAATAAGAAGAAGGISPVQGGRPANFW